MHRLILRVVLLRVLSLGAAFALGLLSVVLLPRDAYACSCNGLSSQTAAQRADAVFTGTLVAKSKVGKPAPGRTELRFEVSRVYKGSVYREQVVASPLDSDGCGLDPELGSSWVIFADEEIEGRGDQAVFRLVTQLCSGNLPGVVAPAILGRGQPPMNGASDREEKADRADAAFSRVLKVGAGLVGGLALVVGAGLALLWRPGRAGR